MWVENLYGKCMPLNTREISILLWLTVFFMLSLKNKGIQKSYVQLLKSLFQNKILIILLLHIFSTVLSIYLPNHLGIWTSLNIKIVSLWFIFTSFAGTVEYVTDRKQTLTILIYDQIKLLIIIEFIAGLKTFALPIELIIVPFIGFAVILNAFVKAMPNGTAAEKFPEWILVVFGISVFTLGVAELFDPDANIAKLIEGMSAPVALSILSIPYLYGLFMYAAYEEVFSIINAFNKNDALVRRYAKYYVLKTFHFSLSKLRNARGRLEYDLSNAQSKVEVRLIVDDWWRKITGGLPSH